MLAQQSHLYPKINMKGGERGGGGGELTLATIYPVLYVILADPDLGRLPGPGQRAVDGAELPPGVRAVSVPAVDRRHPPGLPGRLRHGGHQLRTHPGEEQAGGVLGADRHHRLQPGHPEAPPLLLLDHLPDPFQRHLLALRRRQRPPGLRRTLRRHQHQVSTVDFRYSLQKKPEITKFIF